MDWTLELDLDMGVDLELDNTVTFKTEKPFNNHENLNDNLSYYILIQSSYQNHYWKYFLQIPSDIRHKNRRCNISMKN